MSKKTDLPDYIASILMNNLDKNFVQRIMLPSKNIDLGNGQYGTHLMSWSDNPNGGFMVYPNIIQPQQGWDLMMLNPNDAFDYALKNKEYIPFDNPEDAEWFSKNYKQFWGMY